jgi:hypothetical protein
MTIPDDKRQRILEQINERRRRVREHGGHDLVPLLDHLAAQLDEEDKEQADS